MLRKILLAALLPVVMFGQARLLRHPSYSKGKVAFSYLGDIWTANENGAGVERLTVHQARDIYPRFSPDGNWIAFSSNREGNYDVYVIAAQGGKPRQVTFHSADDTVVGWTPDGKKIIFASSRGKGVFPGVVTMFEIPADGGMEQPIPTDWGSYGSYSADGSRLAFTRHPGVWSRKHYRGSYAVDLWVMDVKASKSTKLDDADYKGNHLWPMYGRNGEIYFVADRLPVEKGIKFGGAEVMKSINNIWKISERGGAPVQVTKHTSGNLFFPSMSADGRTIVYEENFGLWKLDVATGRSTEIRVEIKSDLKDNEVELRTFQSEAESFSLSPTNRRAAISAHGEIFTIATDRGEVQRVTESFWREQDPRWSPNGKWIAYVSDRTGREEFWLADELGKNPKQITDVDCEKSSMVWAPDSKSLMWSGADHKLRRYDVESGKTDELASSNVGNITSAQFSPDGKWISYTKPEAMLRTHVYVKSLAGGEERRIDSDEFIMSGGAKWTPDGKKLLMMGGVGAPSMAALNRLSTQLYSVSLTRIEKNPDDRDVDTEEQAVAAAESQRGGRGPGGGGPGGTAPAKVEVKIEWDGLSNRFRQLTRMAGAVTSVVSSPDSRTYAFVAMGGGGGGAEEGGGGGPGLYIIGDDGTRMTRLSTSAAPGAGGGRGRGGFGGGGFGDPQWARDSRSIYYMQGGGIYTVAVPAPPAGDSGSAPAFGGGGGGRGGRGFGGGAPAPAATASTATPRRIAFTVRVQVDEAAERKQVFTEAWRVMKNRFYDPKMHGTNWAAAKDTYEPLLGNIGDSDELRTVIMQMIGELNASHTGVTGAADAPGQERILTRFPGFDLEPDASGYYKVSSILRKGPADHEYVKLQTGQFVLSVDGKELKTSDNYWKLFNVLPGRKFEFLVNSKPSTDGAWTVVIEPLTTMALGNLEYEAWVKTRKDMVEKLSNGEIGYLHIRAMNAPSLQQFERDLLDNQTKKALIIDQRFNGGGGIDQELLEILQQRRYQSYRGRDSIDMPRPVRAFFGPMVVMQNERSASNAEMFPEGFRQLGLGKVIGVPTYGAVIGTGAYGLMDGSQIRTPSFGVFTAKGENFENWGVPPDVYVDNTPDDFLAGRDRQVEKAVEVLKAQVK